MNAAIVLICLVVAAVASGAGLALKDVRLHAVTLAAAVVGLLFAILPRLQ